jgi:Xaa-Pro aminopeptidase
VGRLRQVKEPGEVELMRRAIAITAEGIRRAASTLRPGLSEGALDGVVYAAFRGQGAEGVAFPSIVGSGFNATTLHYDQNAGSCVEGELVVVDVGARYGYYCGDLTRTLPVSGRFTDRQRALYEVVLNAHDLVAAAIRPGVTLADLRRVAFEAIDGSPLRGADGGPLGQHFIHGIGHFLGLEAHDPGSESDALEPGMVITNEPGIYIPGESLGIRIEDDYLVTDEGAENLSAGLPTRPEEIEGIMRRR